MNAISGSVPELVLLYFQIILIFLRCMIGRGAGFRETFEPLQEALCRSWPGRQMGEFFSKRSADRGQLWVPYSVRRKDIFLEKPSLFCNLIYLYRNLIVYKYRASILYKQQKMSTAFCKFCKISQKIVAALDILRCRERKQGLFFGEKGGSCGENNIVFYIMRGRSFRLPSGQRRALPARRGIGEPDQPHTARINLFCTGQIYHHKISINSCIDLKTRRLPVMQMNVWRKRFP